MNRYRFLLLAALLFAGTAVAIDRDDAQLELAQAINAVQSAERDDAARYAAAELDEAHAMLDSARRASDDRAWHDAATYAARRWPATWHPLARGSSAPRRRPPRSNAASIR